MSLTVTRAEELVRLLTDGLVNIVDSTGEFLLKRWKGWEWTHGIALTALANHASISPSSSSAQYSLRTAMDWFILQDKLSNGKGAPKNINTMSPFFSLACFVDRGDAGTGADKAKWTAWCDEWAEWIMKDLPRTKENGFQHMTYANLHPQQLWDDTLMMTVIPLAKIGLLLNRPQYISESIYQFLLHTQYLADPVTGLWYHGWQFTTDDALKGGHNYANALWARGNSWITISIPLFIEILGDALPGAVKTFLVSTLRRQVDALVATQDKETGLWHTLIVDPTSYVETSASAGFAAGIFAAVRMNLLPKSYLATAQSALEGVIKQIAPDGEVNQVSFGTGMGNDLEFYKKIKITSMPYGQAMAMMAIVEWERLSAVV